MKSETKLPSIRKGASELQMSRTTMENAYMLLAAEGYIVSRPQSGYYVTDIAEKQEEGRKKRSRKGNSKSPRTEEDSASGSVDLAPVSPSPSGEDVAGDFTSCDDTL